MNKKFVKKYQPIEHYNNPARQDLYRFYKSLIIRILHFLRCSATIKKKRKGVFTNESRRTVVHSP